MGVDAALLLTADDVADILGVSTRWVNDRTRSGEIPHVRLGRYVRYQREQVEAWISSLAAGGTARRVRRSA